MKSLWDSGLAHVLRGESTLEELTRVVDIPAEPEAPVRPPAAVPVTHERASPVSTIFDLLEEHAPPARASGAHGQPASKVLLVDDEDSLRKVDARSARARRLHRDRGARRAYRPSIQSIAWDPTSSCSI